VTAGLNGQAFPSSDDRRRDEVSLDEIERIVI
jgi:hypothetical protein